MAVDLRRCPLAAAAAPFGCDWCGRPLARTLGQKRWCGALCVEAYRKNHIWTDARKAAIRRDQHRCVRCGRHDGLEVNHIYPLAAAPGFTGDRGRETCLNHLDGLETLCHEHHVEVTREQRAAGLLRRSGHGRD